MEFLLDQGRRANLFSRAVILMNKLGSEIVFEVHPSEHTLTLITTQAPAGSSILKVVFRENLFSEVTVSESRPAMRAVMDQYRAAVGVAPNNYSYINGAGAAAVAVAAGSGRGNQRVLRCTAESKLLVKVFLSTRRQMRQDSDLSIRFEPDRVQFEWQSELGVGILRSIALMQPLEVVVPAFPSGLGVGESNGLEPPDAASAAAAPLQNVSGVVLMGGSENVNGNAQNLFAANDATYNHDAGDSRFRLSLRLSKLQRLLAEFPDDEGTFCICPSSQDKKITFRNHRPSPPTAQNANTAAGAVGGGAPGNAAAQAPGGNNSLNVNEPHNYDPFAGDGGNDGNDDDLLGGARGGGYLCKRAIPLQQSDFHDASFLDLEQAAFKVGEHDLVLNPKTLQEFAKFLTLEFGKDGSGTGGVTPRGTPRDLLELRFTDPGQDVEMVTRGYDDMFKMSLLTTTEDFPGMAMGHWTANKAALKARYEAERQQDEAAAWQQMQARGNQHGHQPGVEQQLQAGTDVAVHQGQQQNLQRNQQQHFQSAGAGVGEQSTHTPNLGGIFGAPKSAAPSPRDPKSAPRGKRQLGRNHSGFAPGVDPFAGLTTAQAGTGSASSSSSGAGGGAASGGTHMQMVAASANHLNVKQENAAGAATAAASSAFGLGQEAIFSAANNLAKPPSLDNIYSAPSPPVGGASEGAGAAFGNGLPMDSHMEMDVDEAAGGPSSSPSFHSSAYAAAVTPVSENNQFGFIANATGNNDRANYDQFHFPSRQHPSTASTNYAQQPMPIQTPAIFGDSAPGGTAALGPPLSVAPAIFGGVAQQQPWPQEVGQARFGVAQPSFGGAAPFGNMHQIPAGSSFQSQAQAQQMGFGGLPAPQAASGFPQRQYQHQQQQQLNPGVSFLQQQQQHQFAATAFSAVRNETDAVLRNGPPPAAAAAAAAVVVPPQQPDQGNVFQVGAKKNEQRPGRNVVQQEQPSSISQKPSRNMPQGASGDGAEQEDELRDYYLDGHQDVDAAYRELMPWGDDSQGSGSAEKSASADENDFFANMDDMEW